MLAFALAVLIFFSARNRFSDPDTWWHLKVGESIWNTRSIPHQDQYSYTTNHHSWIAHEWLAEVSLYGAYKLGGYRGLWLWLAGFGSLLCILVYALCSLYSGNAKVSLLGGLVGWFFATVSLALRPLLLGHIFLIVELLLLHLGRSRDRRWFWGLPPLFAVWVNCHGSHIFGLGVAALFLFCSFFDFRAGQLFSERWDRRTRLLLGAILPLCAAALMINPIGWRLPAYPLDLLFKQSNNLAYISEWRPLSFKEPWGLGLFAVAALGGVVVLLRRASLRLEEVLLILLGLWMGMRHTRMVFVFGILAAPILCRLLADLWERWDPWRDNRVANTVMILASTALLIAATPTVPELERQVEKSNPVKAVQFIRQAGLAGPMLNEYVWGGYLIWALPEHPTYVDGRTDIFDWTGVFMEYGRWSNLQEDPRLVLEKRKINFCLVSKDATIVEVFPFLPGWKKVYSDEVAAVFARSPAGSGSP